MPRLKQRLLPLAALIAAICWLPASALANALPGKSSAVGIVPHTALRTRLVEYRDGDQVLEGYLAWDESKAGKRPGVLVVHEWTGITEHTHAQVERLAKLGYVAFAADVYGKGVRPEAPQAAGAEAGKYKQDRALFRSRLLAGYRTLLDQAQVDARRVAAVGYCFGGTGVLELARTGAELDGVVSVHGGLDSPNPADGKNIKAKVLILHGAEDPFVKPADIDALLAELRGAAYDANADRRSWLAMRQFLDEIFQ